MDSKTVKSTKAISSPIIRETRSDKEVASVPDQGFIPSPPISVKSSRSASPTLPIIQELREKETSTGNIVTSPPRGAFSAEMMKKLIDTKIMKRG